VLSRDALRNLLAAVARGELTPDEAAERLRGFPSEALDEATVDHQRFARAGFPEVIFGPGKPPETIVRIAERITAGGAPLLATRVSEDAARALSARFPDGRYAAAARVFTRAGREPLPPAGTVAVISAGSSDLPVAEEAAETAGALGAPVERVRDVGVAGLHRILRHERLLREAAALVVVAGMEGALPSVVGGLTDRPVIAVPTSVGYGASFGGLAALLGMLNSCAAGVTVVNIDNGFSAGYTAALIARLGAAPGPAG
jgi:NCAIR mutase (PurE)-related protein